MKKLFSLLLLSCIIFIAKAQHCGLDNAAILLLDIQSEHDTTIINNLKISLIKYNRKLRVSKIKNDFWFHDSTDIVFFWQNPAQTNLKNQSNNDLVPYNTKKRFAFIKAKNNYYLVVARDFPIEKYKLLIEDTDGKENLGHFKSKIYSLKKVKLSFLCSSTQVKWNEVPIKIILTEFDN